MSVYVRHYTFLYAVTVQMMTSDTRTIEDDEEMIMICAEAPNIDEFEVQATVEMMVTGGPQVCE